jgi:DNA (cytosine-5)-methyltransferase 1
VIGETGPPFGVPDGRFSSFGNVTFAIYKRSERAWRPSCVRSVELFAGCGGLALGVAQAGFEHALVVERDADAATTLTANKKRGVEHFVNWPIEKADVRDLDYSKYGQVDLLAGGPPCQPFSIGGKRGGAGDPRNMWGETIRAVRELRPRAFLFENVAGLLWTAFSEYMDFIDLHLRWPEFTDGKNWREKRTMLRRHSWTSKPTYLVMYKSINAADYGVPQKRHRAIIMGVRTDVATSLRFPRPTHSRDALVWAQRKTKTYWERHCIERPPTISTPDKFLLKKLELERRKPRTLPWVTVRDAIADLPKALRRNDVDPNHVFHPGARAYPPRHTGSPWDEPAKALKAGNHGVPGGENIVALGRKNVRYFTLREMARLQGFPDDFVIDGTWMEPIRQLGNAVPVRIGFVFASAIRRVLEQADESAQAQRGRAA